MDVQTKKQARETALRVLYAADVSDCSPSRALEKSTGILSELEPNFEAVRRQVRGRINDIENNFESLDTKLEGVSASWRLERMDVIDRNILRLGIWELLFGDVLPLIVVNACVDLAKKFGAERSHAFVNGLLDEFSANHGIDLNRD